MPNDTRVVGEAAGAVGQGRLASTRTAVNANTGTVKFTNWLVLNPKSQNLVAMTVTRMAGLQPAGLSCGQNVGATTRGIDRVWQVVTTQPLSPAT